MSERGYNGSKTPADERDERQTPQWLFDWLQERYRFFDVDLAASIYNAKCVKFLVDDDQGGALADDVSWASTGKIGFCNPPYSNIDPWFKKAIVEATYGFITVFIVPMPNGDARDALIWQYAPLIINIVGRIEYPRPSGLGIKGNNRGTCVVEFSPDGQPVYGIRSEWVRRDDIRARYETL